MKGLARILCLLACLVFVTGAAAQSYQVGDAVTMGSYEQDHDETNGKEPLEWIVLDTDGDKALLMTKYCIDVKQFYDVREPMYWGASPLRTWMNGEFIAETFTKEEQDRILTTTLDNSAEIRYPANGALDATEDRVFFLSLDEVKHYMPEQAMRMAKPTEYARSKGCTYSEELGTCRWWLRTSGLYHATDICGIRLDGRITHYGMQDVDWPTNTIRPVMWIQVP